jgi:hypothetical protein
MALAIATFSIMTLSIEGSYATHSINNSNTEKYYSAFC